MWSNSRFTMMLVGATAILFFVLIVPDVVFWSILSAQSSTSNIGKRYEDVLRTRGIQATTRQEEELYRLNNTATENRERITDLQRRTFALEQQSSEQRQMHLDIAIMKTRMNEFDARLNTVYELGRIVLGAAIVYLIQVVGGALSWVSSRSKKNENGHGHGHGSGKSWH